MKKAKAAELFKLTEMKISGNGKIINQWTENENGNSIVLRNRCQRFERLQQKIYV